MVHGLKRHPKAKGFEKEKTLRRKLLKRMIEKDFKDEEDLEYEEE